jgi:peptide-methionine (S)-S-oxide reductase
MKPTYVVLAAGLTCFGCRSTGGGDQLPPSAQGSAREAAAPAAAGVRVGTAPGNAGRGTPLDPQPGHELAVFAAGCFWGVEDAYRHVPGVTATAVGYTGGHTKDPTYDAVCGHGTGHAEALLVEFDPSRVSFQRLVDIFFKIHDPTTLNRQGPDVGDQYRSAIFTFSPEQAAQAREAMTRAQAKTPRSIVTQIAPISAFYKAEPYHQQYAERTGTHGCPTKSFADDDPHL